MRRRTLVGIDEMVRRIDAGLDRCCFSRSSGNLRVADFWSNALILEYLGVRIGG